MTATTITTTTVTTTEVSNVGRAVILHTNRYGVVPALGRGGFNIKGLYYLADGKPGYRYESGLIAVVESETTTAYRVRLLNGTDKGATVTICATWVEFA